MGSGQVWILFRVKRTDDLSLVRNTLSEWTAAIGFRATGPERAGGNLHVWYTKDGQSDIGTSSIYTVRKFDGLVLVVDMYGGRVWFSTIFLPTTCTLEADSNNCREEASVAS